MQSAVNLVLVLLAYGLGCVTTGYYLVRLRTGGDVRLRGTGSTGATNAGRALGRAGFLLTFAGDVAKGALAVGIARWLGDGRWVVGLAAMAVVAGHIWPAQLGFRGGKGVAPAFGACLVLAWPVALGALLIAAIAVAILRRFTLSGLIGVAIAPLIALALGRTTADVLAILALAVVVEIGHRRNIRAMLMHRQMGLPGALDRARQRGRSDRAAATKGRPS